MLKFFKYLYFFFAFFKVIHDFPSLKIFELLSFKVLWNGNGIRFQSKLEQLYKLWKLEVSHWIAQHVHADIIVNSLHDVCICNRRCFKITWKMFYILHYLLHLHSILVWSYSPSLTILTLVVWNQVSSRIYYHLSTWFFFSLHIDRRIHKLKSQQERNNEPSQHR